MTTDSTVTPCMIVTISFGTPSRSRIWADCSRNDQSSAPIAMPIGWLRPSSAIAMPAKPNPVGKSCAYAWLSPSSSGMPTRPATAAGEQHGPDHHPLDRRPRWPPRRSRTGRSPAGRSRTGSARAAPSTPTPQAIATTDEAVDLAAGDRDARQVGVGRHRLGGHLLGADDRAEPARVEQVGDDAAADDVQHDRGDDLADPAGHLEQRGDAGPEGADHDRDRARPRSMSSGPGSSQPAADDRGEEGGDAGTARRRRC